MSGGAGPGPGPPPGRVRARRLGRGCVPWAWALGERLVAPKGGGRVWRRDAPASPSLLGASGPASPVRGCSEHLLGSLTAFLRVRPVLGWDRPLPSGRCPFSLFLSSGTYGSIQGHADKCVRRPPSLPPEPLGSPWGCNGDGGGAGSCFVAVLQRPAHLRPQ